MECRFQHPGYVPGGLSFETTWSHVEKVSTGKSQTTNDLYQKFKWKTSRFVVKISGRPRCLPVKWSNHWTPPKKRTGLRFLLHWNFASFIFAKIPVNYLPAESLTPPGRAKIWRLVNREQNAGNGWFLMHCQKQGEFLSARVCCLSFPTSVFQSCGAISPTKTGPRFLKTEDFCLFFFCWKKSGTHLF